MHVAASAALVAATVPLAVRRDTSKIDPFTRSRIDREREAAAARYVQDRDLGGLQSTMARLDEEERAAEAEADEVDVTPEQVRRYLTNPGRLWEETSTEGRRALSEALFNRIDALGPNIVIHASAEAERYGWAEMFGPDPIVCSIGQSGRGERSRTDMSDVRQTIRFVRRDEGRSSGRTA